MRVSKECQLRRALLLQKHKKDKQEANIHRKVVRKTFSVFLTEMRQVHIVRRVTRKHFETWVQNLLSWEIRSSHRYRVEGIFSKIFWPPLVHIVFLEKQAKLFVPVIFSPRSIFRGTRNWYANFASLLSSRACLKFPFTGTLPEEFCDCTLGPAKTYRMGLS